MARLLNKVVVVLALAAGALAQQSIPTGTDGTLDQCQVILGSQALGDGTFDRDTDFTAFVEDGSWSVPLSSILNSTGDVLYVVPAAKSESYQALTGSTRKSAGYCYDTNTLLPQYNPLAVAIPSDANSSVSSVVVSPLSTVLVFGTAYGLTDFTMDLAFGLDPSAEVSTYNYLSEFQTDPTGMAGEFYRASTKVETIVTIGTTLMANTSDSYASFAVLMYQAFGRKALNASSIIWNAHLLNGTEPALDLNDANIVAGIMEDAAGHVYATKDYLLPTQLNQLSSMQYTAAATAAANLNQLTENFNDATTLAKTSYYTQDQIAPMVMDLAEDTTTPQEFMDSTSIESLNSGIASVVLPVGAGNTTASSTYGSSATQAAQSSGSSSGLSGGAIAGIVIGVVAGVAIIAALAGLLLRRRNSSAQPTTGPRSFWRRDQEAVNPAV